MICLSSALHNAHSFQLESYYNISYTIVALLFLSPVAGYSLSAFFINALHVQFGQLGIATLAPICKLIGFVVACVHPPFAVIPVVFVGVGFGNGLEDGAWNAWIGNMENTNELMGFLHGAYGLGATIGPLISTAMITKGNLQWYNWYYVMASYLLFGSVTSPKLLTVITGWACLIGGGIWGVGVQEGYRCEFQSYQSQKIWR